MVIRHHPHAGGKTHPCIAALHIVAGLLETFLVRADRGWHIREITEQLPLKANQPVVVWVFCCKRRKPRSVKSRAPAQMVVLSLFAGGVEKCSRCIRVVGGRQVFGIQHGVIGPAYHSAALR